MDASFPLCDAEIPRTNTLFKISDFRINLINSEPETIGISMSQIRTSGRIVSILSNALVLSNSAINSAPVTERTSIIALRT